MLALAAVLAAELGEGPGTAEIAAGAPHGSPESVDGRAVALAGGFVVYGAVKALVGLRLTQEDEYQGADLSIHKITASPDYNRR